MKSDNDLISASLTSNFAHRPCHFDRSEVEKSHSEMVLPMAVGDFSTQSVKRVVQCI